MVNNEKQISAQTLAEGQRAISIAEFFEKNKHLLGYENLPKSLLTVVREAVDNSLDACEEARILPEVYIEVQKIADEKFKVIVEDNGPGIVKKNIPNVFGKLLYGSKFHRLRQSLAGSEPLVIKKDGRIEILPIGKFVESLLAKNEEERNVSDMDICVPAFDKNTKRYEFRKVSHVIRHKRMNEMLKITAESNRQVTVTGCHSLFCIDSDGNVREAEARNLKEGDYILAPKRMPAGGNIREINILDYIDFESIKGKWIYVYGIDGSVLKNILDKSEVIHKKTGKSRRYYRVTATDGTKVDILDDSFNQYVCKGFMPLHLVMRLGLKDKVGGCVLQTYYHGKKTKTPVTWELTPSLMRFIGLFIAEGHVDVRQIGFTFGKHEGILIDEVCGTARMMGSNVTIEQRDRSVRVKVFANVLPLLMENWCKRGAANKRIPEFAFRAEERLRQHLLDGLYLGDGHMVKNRNCLMLNTISKPLANDVMYLWLMQGILACLTQKTGCGLGSKPSTCYVVSVYGKDIETTHAFHLIKEVKTKRLINSGAAAAQLVESDLCQLKIKKIERINEEGFEHVYDISVPMHENFVGGMGGLSCHNSRGQQGIGISGAVLYAQLTTGKPAKIYSRPNDGQTHIYELRVDTQKNEPEIVSENSIYGSGHGTRIEMEIKGKYVRGKQSVQEYLQETAIMNPFAKLVFVDPDNEKFEFVRGVDELPVEPKEIQPHPAGVELGVLIRMLKNTKSRNITGFLTGEFSRIGRGTALEICEGAGIDPQISPYTITREEAEKLHTSIGKAKIQRPPTDCLSPVGEKAITEGIKKELNPEFVASVSRSPEVYRGYPFQIEVGICYGGPVMNPQETVQVMRYANKVPLLYEQSACAITKSIIQTDWRRYGLSQSANSLPVGPAVIAIHFASVWVPYTSEGKEAIASYPEIIKEVKLGLQEAARKLAIYLGKKRRAGEAIQRLTVFQRYSPEVADALATLTGKPIEGIKAKFDALISEKMKDIKLDDISPEDLKEAAEAAANGEEEEEEEDEDEDEGDE